MESAVNVLKSDAALRKRLAERIRHVIVDEYQDVNPVQEAVVWALHDLDAKICVVGDDDQTIYQWRRQHSARNSHVPKALPKKCIRSDWRRLAVESGNRGNGT